MIKKIPLFWKATLVSFILCAIFLNNFLLNLDKPMVFSDGSFATARLSHGDSAHVAITLKHYMEIFTTGDFKNILNVPIFYGFSNSLLFSEPFLLHGIVGLPIFLVTHNILVTFNLLAFLSIYTGFLAMFYLAWYWTKSFWPSILASIIFVFNPFIFARFPEHLTYYTLVFVPLVFLYLEKSIRDQKAASMFWLFTFLALQMVSTLTFGVLMSIVLPIYFLIRYFQLKPKLIKFLNWGSITGALLFLAVTLTFFFTYNGFYSKDPIGRGLDETAYYSAWFSDFFLASPNNFLYGSVRDNLSQSMPNFIFEGSEITERNLFWGFTAIVLFVLSFKYLKKDSEYRQIWIVLVAIIVTTVLLSFGPMMTFSTNFQLPGLYLLAYFINPGLHFLRVASRFAFFTDFALGLLCAITLSKIISHKSKQKALIISLVVIFLMLFEYWNKPWPVQNVPDSTKTFYGFLDQQKDIKAIVELPMGNLVNKISDAKYQFVDSDYMLSAATLHSKKLLNGYSSYIPPKYISRVEYLTINFPNDVKLQKLKDWGVGGIVLHKKDFANPARYDQIRSSLQDLGAKELESNDQMALFDISQWKPQK